MRINSFNMAVMDFVQNHKCASCVVGTIAVLLLATLIFFPDAAGTKLQGLFVLVKSMFS